MVPLLLEYGYSPAGRSQFPQETRRATIRPRQRRPGPRRGLLADLGRRRNNVQTSAPGCLLKLRSGRQALVSNDKAGRVNLLLAFSEHDAQTWTKPIVLACQKEGQSISPGQA